MKEELQGKLVEILTSIQTATGKAADFAFDQLPDIAQSFVAYGRASTTFTVLAALAIVALCSWQVAKASRGDTDEPINIIRLMVGGSVGLFSGVIFLVETPTMLLAWFAPKVWLLKELATLFKG